jgi:hypothetical protein
VLFLSRRQVEDSSILQDPNDAVQRRKDLIRESMGEYEWAEAGSTFVACKGMQIKMAQADGPENADAPKTTHDSTRNTDEALSFPDRPGCAICLNNFEGHDVVCASNNGSCCHLYHKGCITAWLLKHDGCPECREKFLVESA